jgi:hypothetical protein
VPCSRKRFSRLSHELRIFAMKHVIDHLNP